MRASSTPMASPSHAITISDSFKHAQSPTSSALTLRPIHTIAPYTTPRIMAFTSFLLMQNYSAMRTRPATNVNARFTLFAGDSAKLRVQSRPRSRWETPRRGAVQVSTLVSRARDQTAQRLRTTVSWSHMRRERRLSGRDSHTPTPQCCSGVHRELACSEQMSGSQALRFLLQGLSLTYNFQSSDLSIKSSIATLSGCSAALSNAAHDL